MLPRLNQRTFGSLLKRLSIFFFLIFIFGGLSARSFFNSAKFDLYRAIQLNGGNRTTKLEYIKESENFIRKEGLALKIVGSIPILEYMVCGENSLKKGDIYFIENKKLCSIGVVFYPGANVFIFSRLSDSITVPEGWGFLKSGDEVLFFRENAQFAGNSMSDGRVIEKMDSGAYMDSLGKAMYPLFVYENEKWNAVIPLRESFVLNVDEDSSFNLELFTSSSFPFDAQELIDVIGIKSESVTAGTVNAYTYNITGSGFKGIRIPGFSKNRERSIGKYIIAINTEGERKNFSTSVKKENYSLLFRVDNNGLYFEMIIERSKLTDAEMNEIYLFMKKYLPIFYRKDG